MPLHFRLALGQLTSADAVELLVPFINIAILAQTALDNPQDQDVLDNLQKRLDLLNLRPGLELNKKEGAWGTFKSPKHEFEYDTSVPGKVVAILKKKGL